MLDNGSGCPELMVLLRHDWTRSEVAALIGLPFPDLLFRAQVVHRAHFDPAEVWTSECRLNLRSSRRRSALRRR